MPSPPHAMTTALAAYRKVVAAEDAPDHARKAAEKALRKRGEYAE